MRAAAILILAAVIFCASAATDDISGAPTDGVYIDVALSSVATSLTNLCLTPASVVKDCWIGFVTVTNTTGPPITLIAQDGQGAPFQLFSSVSIPGNTTVGASWQPSGLKMVGGLRIQAGGAGLHLALHAKRVK